MTVKELEQAITNLSREEFAQFREWFYAFAEDAWDRQIAADAAAGKLDKLAEEAIADYKAGRVRQL